MTKPAFLFFFPALECRLAVIFTWLCKASALGHGRFCTISKKKRAKKKKCWICLGNEEPLGSSSPHLNCQSTERWESCLAWRRLCASFSPATFILFHCSEYRLGSFHTLEGNPESSQLRLSLQTWLFVFHVMRYPI
ncbi:hypothetical protein LX36DRAFT_486563 [Colletotrichum falcatum]|nr:hypothetical protein LX36DRAFT_486563 [Colletotrichum falcatum]